MPWAIPSKPSCETDRTSGPARAGPSKCRSHRRTGARHAAHVQRPSKPLRDNLRDRHERSELGGTTTAVATLRWTVASPAPFPARRSRSRQAPDRARRIYIDIYSARALQGYIVLRRRGRCIHSITTSYYINRSAAGSTTLFEIASQDLSSRRSTWVLSGSPSPVCICRLSAGARDRARSRP